MAQRAQSDGVGGHEQRDAVEQAIAGGVSTWTGPTRPQPFSITVSAALRPDFLHRTFVPCGISPLVTTAAGTAGRAARPAGTIAAFRVLALFVIGASRL